jgi:hypothetical protein
MGGGLRSRSHILVAGHSSRERLSSTFWNLAANSPTTSAWEVSLGERPSTNSAAEDTTFQNAASSLPFQYDGGPQAASPRTSDVVTGRD